MGEKYKCALFKRLFYCFPDYFSGHHHHPKNLEILFDWMNALFSRDILKFWNCFTYLEVKWRHSKWAMSAANNGIQYSSAFNGRVCSKKKMLTRVYYFYSLKLSVLPRFSSSMTISWSCELWKLSNTFIKREEKIKGIIITVCIILLGFC